MRFVVTVVVALALGGAVGYLSRGPEVTKLERRIGSLEQDVRHTRSVAKGLSDGSERQAGMYRDLQGELDDCQEALARHRH
jgi:hypothetical protein